MVKRKSNPATDRRYKHDWPAIRAYYEAGHTILECQKKFGFYNITWRRAVVRGAIVSRPAASVPKPLAAMMVRNSSYSRANLKRQILQQKLIPYACAVCGQKPVWKGKPLVLILDHENGVNDDHRRENLRFVCPNCGSQLPTFAARNRCRVAQQQRDRL